MISTDRVYLISLPATFAAWLWHTTDAAPDLWEADPWGAVFMAFGMMIVPLVLAGLIAWPVSRFVGARYATSFNSAYLILTLIFFPVVRAASG